MIESATFGSAVEHLKADNNCVISRAGWNGKGQWVMLQRPDKHSKMSRPYLYINTAQNDLVPWVPSISDILSEDWTIECKDNI